MMRCGLTAVLFGLLPAVATAAGEALVTLLPAEQQRAEVAVMTAQWVTQAQTATAYAQVVDAAPLALLHAEIESRRAAAAASTAEAERAQRLWQADENLSRRDYEQARAQALADAAQLDAARQRLALEWGPGLARLTDVSRGQLLRRLASAQACLLRVPVPDAAQSTQGLVVRLGDAAGPPAHLETIGAAASREAGAPGLALLVLADRGLQAGAMVPVQVQREPVRGVRLPPSALLADGEGSFVYVVQDDAHFARTPVRVLDERGSEVLVSGLRDDSRVVVRNAAAVHWAAQAPAAAAAKDRDD